MTSVVVGEGFGEGATKVSEMAPGIMRPVEVSPSGGGIEVDRDGEAVRKAEEIHDGGDIVYELRMIQGRDRPEVRKVRITWIVSDKIFGVGRGFDLSETDGLLLSLVWRAAE